MSELFEHLKDVLGPEDPRGKCIYCGELTVDVHLIADDVDEDGRMTGCKEFCCDNCYENMMEKI